MSGHTVRRTALLLAVPLALAAASAAHAQPQPRYEGNRGQAPTSPYGSLYLNRFFFDTEYHHYSRTPDRAQEELRRRLGTSRTDGDRVILVPTAPVVAPADPVEPVRPILRPGIRPDLIQPADPAARPTGLRPVDPVPTLFRLYDYDLFGPGERYDYRLNRTRETDPAARPDNNFHRNHPDSRTLPRR